jgi:hypothetical protein
MRSDTNFFARDGVCGCRQSLLLFGFSFAWRWRTLIFLSSPWLLWFGNLDFFFAIPDMSLKMFHLGHLILSATWSFHRLVFFFPACFLMRNWFGCGIVVGGIWVHGTYECGNSRQVLLRSVSILQSSFLDGEQSAATLVLVSTLWQQLRFSWRWTVISHVPRHSNSAHVLIAVCDGVVMGSKCLCVFGLAYTLCPSVWTRFQLHHP